MRKPNDGTGWLEVPDQIIENSLLGIMAAVQRLADNDDLRLAAQLEAHAAQMEMHRINAEHQARYEAERALRDELKGVGGAEEKDPGEETVELLGRFLKKQLGDVDG
jgi:hypothetical protein